MKRVNPIIIFCNKRASNFWGRNIKVIMTNNKNYQRIRSIYFQQWSYTNTVLYSNFFLSVVFVRIGQCLIYYYNSN